MSVFSNDDDFSKDFLNYLSESYIEHIQHKKLQEKNNQIIKNNIKKLETCIKNNLNNDNTKPFDKTFICDGFEYLMKNNNNQIETNKEINIDQYKKPFAKLNLTKTSINDDSIDFISGYPVRGLAGIT